MPPLPKTIGRYDIIELVGRGGMGVLYRARDPVLERDVALKMMHVDFSLDDTARERFQREAKAVARLQHRNVVTIHELGEVEGTPFIVMELLSGRDLDALIKKGDPLTLSQKLDIAAQVCDGLAYAHDQGIVHRDIKPGNVRVLEDGTVKILDFGIAKFAMSNMTQSGTVMGTPSYMAPEQIRGQPLDRRADLFSVGVLLYELLSGKRPFMGESATAVVYQIMNVQPPSILEALPDLPEGVNQIVTRALEKDPADRYSRAKDMSVDLQTVRSMITSSQKPRTGSVIIDPAAHTLAMTPQLHANTASRRVDITPPAGTSQLRTPSSGSVVARTPGATSSQISGVRSATGSTPRPATVPPGTIPPGTIAPGTGAQPAADSRSNVPMVIVAAAVLVLVVALGGWMYLSGGKPSTGGTTGGGTSGGTTTGTSGAAPSIALSSTPAGARILLNGVDTGKVTPATIAIPGQGPGKLELSLKGYQPIAVTLGADDIKAGSKAFKFTSDARAVRLAVSGSYPFEVVQGGRVLSAMATEHSLTIQPGAGSVSVRNAEYLLGRALSIDGQRAQTAITLPEPGVLFVRSADETCSVKVDGQDLGPVPIANKAIADGAHTVVLKCAGGRSETRKTTVPPGERTVVIFGAPKS